MKAENHPFPEWRKDQLSAIQSCVGEINKGTKYIILEGPTGSGKSAVAVEILRRINGGRILTSQILLQEQYKGDYEEFELLKGSDRYPCHKEYPPKVLNNMRTPVHQYKWIGQKDTCGEKAKWRHKPSGQATRCGDCNYTLAVDKTAKAKYSIMNYHTYYYQNKYRQNVFKGTNVVLDEAHNLNNIATSLFTREFREYGGFTFHALNKEDCYQNKNYGPKIDIINKDYVDQVLLDYRKHLENRIKICERRKSSSSHERELEWALEKKREVEYQIHYVKQPYFTYSLEDRGKHKVLVSKPIDSRRLLGNTFFRDNHTIIFMSATIIDSDIFCKEVGIKPEKVFHYRMKDVFNPSRHLIRFVSEPKNMRLRDREISLKEVLPTIERILSRHEGQKGIIHGQAYSVCSTLAEGLNSRRILFGRDRDRILADHSASKDSVILSPSMKEGLNLIGKESEFQILLVVPYPTFDLHTLNKMKINGKYYQWATAVDFVQSLGRSVRSVEDTCVSYLVDSRFYAHINLMHRNFSRYLQKCLPFDMEKIDV